MKQVKRGVLVLAALVALIYAGDYLAVRIPIPKSRMVYENVTVQRYYDVGLKSGKSDFYFLDPIQQTCVISLFPHMGYSPCWYVKKHAQQRIKM